jgi:hypothetical protein
MFGDPHHGSAGIGQPWLAVSGWSGTGRAGLWSASNAVFAPGSALNTKLSAPAVLQAWLASCVGAWVPLWFCVETLRLPSTYRAPGKFGG